MAIVEFAGRSAGSAIGPWRAWRRWEWRLAGRGFRAFHIGRIALEAEQLYAALDGLPWACFAMTLDQRIVYWGKGAREALGYAPGTVLGRRCSEVPSGLDRYGLTADCGEGCACLRYARVGMVPSPVSLEMRSAWGELKTIEVKPLAVAGVCSLGRVLVYLLDVGRREEVVVGPSWVVSAVASGVGAEAGEVSLTPREVEVLRLVALGWGNEFIAEELRVTVFTVRTHIANLRRKLGANDRFEAVMTALRLGILELR